MSRSKPNQTSAAPITGRNRQPNRVKNDAPGYGDKKLEGPNRPST